MALGGGFVLANVEAPKKPEQQTYRAAPSKAADASGVMSQKIAPLTKDLRRDFTAFGKQCVIELETRTPAGTHITEEEEYRFALNGNLSKSFGNGLSRMDTRPTCRLIESTTTAITSPPTADGLLSKCR